jgi:Uma2 family endonuclease
MTAAVKRVAPVPARYLVESDGIPLESIWHVNAMLLLLASVHHRLRPRKDYFAGGNNFIYYSAEQARNKDYRGPDFYFVDGVPLAKKRKYWAVWDEGGRFPDFIVELMSPTTAHEDLTTKKTLYERTFRTPEYFCYDPDTHKLHGWRLSAHGRYRKIPVNKQGWMWSEVLHLYVGLWEGTYLGVHDTFVRFFDADGSLVLTAEEELEELKKDRRNGR